jgi:hypothetical protein
MLFKSLCFFLLFIINNAFSNSEKPDHFDQKTSFILNNYFSNYNLLGHAKYKYLFFDIYDASLVSQEENFNNNNFALILKYNRKITKESVINETINDFKKQRTFNKNEIDKLKNLLDTTFKNIKIDDIFIAIKKDNAAFLYFEGEKVLEIEDQDFINIFFNIWLRKDSQDPDFTKALLDKK